MRFSEFASKDVVSVDSGERLGQVNDIDFDEHYHIRLLYVSERASGLRRVLPWLFSGEERMVREEEIVGVGKDVTLVRTCKKVAKTAHFCAAATFYLRCMMV